MGVAGICKVERIWQFEIPQQQFVVFTELPKNPGPSITNAIESLIKQYCSVKEISLAETIFLERYMTHPEDLDAVTIENGNAQWRRLSTIEAKPILDCLS